MLQGAFSKGEIAELTEVLDPLELASNELLRQMQDKRLNIARADEIVFRPHVVSADTRVKKICLSSCTSETLSRFGWFETAALLGSDSV